MVMNLEKQQKSKILMTIDESPFIYFPYLTEEEMKIHTKKAKEIGRKILENNK